MILLIVLSVAAAALAGFAVVLWTSLRSAPRVGPAPPTTAALTVIVPAYNEAENIEACVRSILAGGAHTEVLVIDDQSTDDTLQILERLQRELNDPRLVIVHGARRPEGEWLGKNWACAQGAARARGDYVLFVDADVRIAPGGIDAAMAAALREEADLLTMAPALTCGCPSEWIVQPIMVQFMGIRFDFAKVHDPASPRAFACGPFMLFKRSAYDLVGGHEAVAREVVEDVMFARRIKAKGLRLRLVIGPEAASLRMYTSFSALWEGWTKSIYFAMDRSLVKSVASCFAMLLLYPTPWVGLAIGLVTLSPALIGVAAAGIALQYVLRWITRHHLGLPTRYWWTSGVGGALICAMAIASVIKSETGWGWTWRGRSLSGVAHRG
jgi:hypothetical protein